MVSSTCLHFCVSHSGHHTCLTKFFTRSTQLQFYNTWHTCCGIRPLLSHSADHRGDYCCGNDNYPESTRESKQNRNTTGTRRTHIAHLGISNIIHAGGSRVLKVLKHKVKCHPQLEMDWRLSWCCKAARILTLNVLPSMVKIEKEDAFCRWSMFVLF